MVALGVALVFPRNVLLERLGRCPTIHLYGVVDDKICRNLRIDSRRIDAEFNRGIAQRGEVDNSRDTGEVLEYDARW